MNQNFNINQNNQVNSEESEFLVQSNTLEKPESLLTTEARQENLPINDAPALTIKDKIVKYLHWSYWEFIVLVVSGLWYLLATILAFQQEAFGALGYLDSTMLSLIVFCWSFIFVMVDLDFKLKKFAIIILLSLLTAVVIIHGGIGSTFLSFFYFFFFFTQLHIIVFDIFLISFLIKKTIQMKNKNNQKGFKMKQNLNINQNNQVNSEESEFLVQSSNLENQEDLAATNAKTLPLKNKKDKQQRWSFWAYIVFVISGLSFIFLFLITDKKPLVGTYYLLGKLFSPIAVVFFFSLFFIIFSKNIKLIKLTGVTLILLLLLGKILGFEKIIIYLFFFSIFALPQTLIALFFIIFTVQGLVMSWRLYRWGYFQHKVWFYLFMSIHVLMILVIIANYLVGNLSLDSDSYLDLYMFFLNRFFLFFYFSRLPELIYYFKYIIFYKQEKMKLLGV